MQCFFHVAGLASYSDNLFKESFITAYSQATLKDIPWYAVLGKFYNLV